MTTFTEHCREQSGLWDVFSQNGEDGLIQIILDMIKPQTMTCMEFGAADGFFCSNTAYLWNKCGWQATLVESGDDLFSKLERVTRGNSKVDAFHDSVANPDVFCPDVLDLISIDVDGEDFTIWERSDVRHRVVVIEHNPTFPPHVEMHAGQWIGSSAASLVRLGELKEYKFLMATKTNCFFVRNEDAEVFDRFDCSLRNNFDSSSLNYVVTDYHGNFDVAGSLPYGMNWKVEFGMHYE